ncbi:MAG: hypothetical protein HXY45_02075 [Syntrophaceae bacterium]|jgi:hypothetical protein|nr:hypothetical protein [Syntrophaceae bacterium]
MRYFGIALFLILGLAIGCSPIIEGKKIDSAQNKNLLAPGTGAEKVVQMYGQPQQKEELPSGETKYTYFYREMSRVWWHTDPEKEQKLEVFLKGNEVQRYRYSDRGVDPITTDVPPIQPEKK